MPFERDDARAHREHSRSCSGRATRATLFVELLAAGRGAIPVFEALDHVGVLVRLLPEWEHVRARPQRNAYHRFTVDRHSLEAVAECAAMLDPDDPGPASTATSPRRAPRATCCSSPRCSTTSARAVPGDHSVVGVEHRGVVAERIGLATMRRPILAWLVRNHLLLADTATRRDLSDERTITRFAAGRRRHGAPRPPLRADHRRLAGNRPRRVEREQGGARA